MLHGVVTFIAFLLFHNTVGIDIPITNPSFETDDFPLPNNTYHYWQTHGVTGWVPYDPNNVMDYWSTGVMNPQGGNAYHDSIYGSSCPDGLQGIYLEPESEQKEEGKGEFGVEQVVTNHTITANTTYTLSVYIGNTDDNTWSASSTDPSYKSTNRDGFPGYKIVLLTQDDVVLAQDDNALTINEGQWALSTVQAIINADDPNIEQVLKIRLVHKNSAKNSGYEVGFDGITLTAHPHFTPAPTMHPLTANPTTGPTKAHVLQATSPTPPPTPYIIAWNSLQTAFITETVVTDTLRTTEDAPLSAGVMIAVIVVSVITVVMVIAASSYYFCNCKQSAITMDKKEETAVVEDYKPYRSSEQLIQMQDVFWNPGSSAGVLGHEVTKAETVGNDLSKEILNDAERNKDVQLRSQIDLECVDEGGDKTHQRMDTNDFPEGHVITMMRVNTKDIQRREEGSDEEDEANRKSTKGSNDDTVSLAADEFVVSSDAEDEGQIAIDVVDSRNEVQSNYQHLYTKGGDIFPN